MEWEQDWDAIGNCQLKGWLFSMVDSIFRQTGINKTIAFTFYFI